MKPSMLSVNNNTNINKVKDKDKGYVHSNNINQSYSNNTHNINSSNDNTVPPRYKDNNFDWSSLINHSKSNNQQFGNYKENLIRYFYVEIEIFKSCIYYSTAEKISISFFIYLSCINVNINASKKYFT